MYKTKSWFRIIMVTLLLSFVIACGQKGDLYLPESDSTTSLVR